MGIFADTSLNFSQYDDYCNKNLAFLSLLFSWYVWQQCKTPLGGRNKIDPLTSVPFFKPFSKQILKFLTISYQNKSKVSCLVGGGRAKNFKNCWENGWKGGKLVRGPFFSCHPVHHQSMTKVNWQMPTLVTHKLNLDVQ